MKLPVETFNALSNPAISIIEYFQPNDSLIYPWGMPILGDSLLLLDNDVITGFNRRTGLMDISFS